MSPFNQKMQRYVLISTSILNQYRYQFPITFCITTAIACARVANVQLLLGRFLSRDCAGYWLPALCQSVTSLLAHTAKRDRKEKSKRVSETKRITPWFSLQKISQFLDTPQHCHVQLFPQQCYVIRENRGRPEKTPLSLLFSLYRSLSHSLVCRLTVSTLTYSRLFLNYGGEEHLNINMDQDEQLNWIEQRGTAFWHI